MHIIISIVIAAAVSYLLGSLNCSIIVVKLLKHEDVRKFGSGNAGLTNTLRCFGKGCAALTLIGDLSKGVIAVLLSRLFCGMLGGGFPGNDTYYIGYIAGFFAILGHVFPIYYGFKGGKGVLVGVSTFIAVNPAIFFILIGVFAIVLIISKYVSLSSMIAAAMGPFVAFVLHYASLEDNNRLKLALFYFALSAIMSGMVIAMHKENIQRLKNGTENKFKFRNK